MFTYSTSSIIYTIPFLFLFVPAQGRGWNKIIFKVSFNPNHSVSRCFIQIQRVAVIFIYVLVYFYFSLFQTLHCWIVQEEIYSKQLQGIRFQPQLINMSCAMTRRKDCCSGAQREHSCPYLQDCVDSQDLPQQNHHSSPAHSLGYLQCKGSISAHKQWRC